MTQRPTQLLLDGRPVFLGWAAVGEAEEGTDALTPAERAHEARAPSPKRRDDYRAGRTAAHRAIAAAGGSACDVLSQAEGIDAGRPVLHPRQGLSISISHSGGWAVALVAAGDALGIDLEAEQLDAGAAFEREAFAPGELDDWRRPAAAWPSCTSLAWCAKEAVLKVWGIGLRAPLGQLALCPQAWAGETGRGFVIRADHRLDLALPRPDWFSACAWRLDDRVMVAAQRLRPAG